jgi:hypothetical protein
MTHVAAMGVHTTIEDKEVTLLLGPDAAFVNTWSTTQQCGTAADLPASPAPETPANAILRRLVPRRLGPQKGNNPGGGIAATL